MALSETKVNINRTTSGLVLPKEISDEIWAEAVKDSAVMQVAQRMEIPGTGETVQLITGDATAAWVTESTEKAVSSATFSDKTITPYKLSVIELFSMEFRRDLPKLYDELVRRLPYSIGKKFDETVFHGTAPGTGFDVLSDATAVSIEGTSTSSVYNQLVTAFTTVAAGGYNLDGWVFAPQAWATLLAAVDGNGRPLLIDSVNNDSAIGRILGATTYSSKNVYAAGSPNVVGVAGDWTQSRYGVVDGINVAISEEATINDGTNSINLWQRNMFAVRVEAELAFAVKDSSAFVRLTTPAS